MKKDFKYLFNVTFITMLIIMYPLSTHAFNSKRRNFSIESKWGYYVMDNSKWESERGYGGKYTILGAMKFNLDIFRQVIQLGAGIGYFREDKPNYYLYNLPIEASLNIRFKFSTEQLIVPYIGGGIDYSYFKEKSKYLDDLSEPTVSIIHVSRNGYHINAGIQLLLDDFDPTYAKRFDEKYGVNSTYLTFEARYTDLTNFSKLAADKTDVSGWLYTMGFLFEF